MLPGRDRLLLQLPRSLVSGIMVAVGRHRRRPLYSGGGAIWISPRNRILSGRRLLFPLAPASLAAGMGMGRQQRRPLRLLSAGIFAPVYPASPQSECSPVRVDTVPQSSILDFRNSPVGRL